MERKILKANASRSTVTFPNPGDDGYTLEQLKEAIGGGYIEVVSIPGVDQDKILVVDEDGHRKDLPYNHTASYIAGQTIVGDALICLRTDIR